MSTHDSLESAYVIACDPDAVPAEVREQSIAAGRRVDASVQDMRELPMGYTWAYTVTLAPDSVLVRTLANYLASERLCCPFLHFTVDIEANGGPFRLQLTRGPGVKDDIRSVFATSDLLNEGVMRTAGLQ